MVILVIKTNIIQSWTNNMGVSFIWNQTFWLVVTDRLVQIVECMRETDWIYMVMVNHTCQCEVPVLNS